MIGQSRTRPILILFAIGTFFVLLRMFEIQVGEHRFWALEAARLVHSGREIPYRRGEVKDARGQVLARDKDTHHLVLVYRDFRRGHPLGQIAHGRSVLMGRPVALRDAEANLLDWGAELVSLRPADLAAFADGEPLALGSLVVPASDDPRAENRRRRALDAGFYAKRLLPLSPRQLRSLEKLARDKEGKELAFVDLAARVLSSSEGPTEPTTSGRPRRSASAAPWSSWSGWRRGSSGRSPRSRT
jgi:cell division protein FtsI/penicillin-binding protein 2